MGAQLSPTKADTRLDRLDGLRGIAALAVVLYHYTVRWTEPYHRETLYPFGTIFPDTFPFLVGAGDFGVRLFFVTSGFVILLTLEKSSGLLEFAFRRIARLWPTMLVCATLSTLIINLSGFADRVPSVARFEVTPLEYFSSVFFIAPNLVASVIGAPRSHWVEGVYWTLWAEVRFYAVIAIVWYLFGRRFFKWAWLSLLLTSVAAGAGSPVFESYWAQRILTLILQPGYLAWFSFGIVAYKAWKREFGAVELAILGTCILSAFWIEPSTMVGINLTVLLAFLIAILRGPWTRFLTFGPLLSIGLASYPLYLFHERFGVILLHDLGNAGVPTAILLPGMFITAIAAALIIHRLIETPSRQWIRRRTHSQITLLQNEWRFLKFRNRDTS